MSGCKEQSSRSFPVIHTLLKQQIQQRIRRAPHSLAAHVVCPGTLTPPAVTSWCRHQLVTVPMRQQKEQNRPHPPDNGWKSAAMPSPAGSTAWSLKPLRTSPSTKSSSAELAPAACSPGQCSPPASHPRWVTTAPCSLERESSD